MIVTLAAAIAVAGVVFGVQRARGRAAPPERTEPVKQQPAIEVIDDPLVPGRRMRVVGPRGDGVRGAGSDESWVDAPPSPRWRPEKPPSERGGVDPCNTPDDPGFEGYSHWQSLGGSSRYLVPESGAFDEQGRFDLVLHFHGHDIARKDFVNAKLPVVLLGMSLGSGGGYRTRLAGPEAFDHLVGAVEAALEKERKSPAKARRIALSAWSGGYEAVGMLLEHAPDRVDAVILLDGLHGSRKPDTLALQLEPFTKFAERAAEGEVSMVVTHSSIDPGTYASTTETAHHLIDAVGGRPLSVRRDDRYGLELIEAFSQRSFHVRGYAGGGEADHCAHLALYRDGLAALARRWKLR